MKKVAIVTGSSSGLGFEVSTKLAEAGFSVYALARNSQSTQYTHTTIVPIDCNLRDLDSIDRAFALIDSKEQRIDLLVNCAGRALIKKLEQITREEIMDVFGVNLKGNIYIAQETYKRMLKTRSGHIINIGSTSGIRAREYETIYCASKWGLRGFTESLRLEAKPHGIKVAGVYPGGMKSNFWNFDKKMDLSKFMNPADVATKIVDLATKDSGIATSEIIIERP